MLIFKFKKLFKLNFESIILIMFCIVFVLRGYNRFYVFNKKYNYLYKLKNLNVEIVEKKSISDDKISYLVKYDNNNFLLSFYRSDTENIEEFYKKYNYFPLDIINVTVKESNQEKLNNPYEFDYKRYLNSNNIVCNLTNYSNVQVLDIEKKKSLKRVILTYKNYINSKLEENLDTIHLNFFKSIMYSEDLLLDKSINNNFENCGASFMLTTSGTHVLAFLYVLDFFLKKDSKFSKYLKILFLIMFSMFVGFKLSLVRAVISQILIIVLNLLNIQISHIKRTVIIFCCMLTYNFYYIFNVAFILSFLCVLSIIVFSNLISSFFNRIIFLKFMKKYYYKNSNIITKTIKYILKIFALNISVILGTLPVQINFFHEINILSVIYNIPLSIICMAEYVLGFFTLILSGIPLISDIITSSNFVVLECIIKLVQIFSNNSLKLILASFNLIEIILYYSLIVIIIYKIYFLKKIKKNKRLKLNKTLKFLAISFILIFFSSYVYRTNFKNYIIFFNVRQGNMALIKQNNKIIVIDSGSTSDKLAANVLENYLKSIGVNKIDLVLITHFHSDHVNGIYNLDDDISVKNIAYLKPEKEFDVEVEYKKVLSYMKEKNITSIELSNLDTISFKNVKITSFIPEVIINDTDIANSNSVMFLINIKGKKCLFMGDSTKETEKYYLEKNNESYLNELKNVDFYQVGHHGSKTSTSEEFIKDIYPKNAIISSNKKVYSETIDIIEKLNIKYYITENDGAIYFYTN